LYDYFKLLVVVMACRTWPLVTVLWVFGSARSAGVFGIPELKLATCIINKTGSSAVFKLLHEAKGDPTNLRGDSLAMYVGTPSILRILKDPAWTVFVVMREPAERFSSAFSSRCGRAAIKGNCPVKPGDVHAMLDLLEHWYDEKGTTRKKRMDAHYRSFSEDCELIKHLSDYTVIAYEHLETGLATVVRELPTLGEQNRTRLLKVVRGLFLHLHSGNLSTTSLHIAPIGSSAATVARWKSVAGTTHADADIWPRLQRFYAEDYALYSAWQAKSTTRSGLVDRGLQLIAP
jgi:hypothetical protein